MGVDVTVFLGRVRFLEDPEGPWFQIAAMVDMGRDPVLSLATVAAPFPTVYLYAPAGDGNERVTEDKYGTRLTAWPVDRLEALLTGESMLRALLAAAPPWVTHAVVYCS